jgi:hypothetical protein
MRWTPLSGSWAAATTGNRRVTVGWQPQPSAVMGAHAGGPPLL